MAGICVPLDVMTEL